MFNLYSKTKPTLMRLCTLLRISVYIACISAVYASNTYAQSEKPEIVDLTPSGWNRNTELVGLRIDQYQTASGSLNIDLLAFPPTDLSASQWIDKTINALLHKSQEEGSDVTVINNDEKADTYVQGAMNSSDNNVDIATRTFTIKRDSTNNRTISRVARAIIRQGQAAQFSLVDLGKAPATEQEWKQASSIRFEADLPFFKEGAVLGFEFLASTMVGILLNTDNTAEQTAQKPLTASSNLKSEAPALKILPGPQVQLTGKWLSSLPEGYRMHVKTKNYWTNSDMTATRTLHLTLTGDGQFEKGSWSIDGGSLHMPGSVFSSDKNGSHGSVFGDTNPSGPGTKSIAMTTREGLNPEKYGVYYISGNQIEFRYASGKVETKSFKTDGHHELVIDKKRYFTGSPKGWETRDLDTKVMRYRGLNGAYIARVHELPDDIENGSEWIRNFLTRLKKANSSTAGSKIKSYEVKSSSYKLVRTTITGSNKNGQKYTTDIYLKYGRFDNRLIEIDRYGGSKGEDKILDFIKSI